MQTEKYLRKLLDVDRDTINKWRFEFSSFLSDSATQKGKTRIYTESDIRVLALINEYWEEHPDYENIRMMLNNNEQDSERYFELVYLSTPVFKKVQPDDIEYPHSLVFLDSRTMQESILFARAYKNAGDVLTNNVLGNLDLPWELANPIFYLYRHAIELYLKIIVGYDHDAEDKGSRHSLSRRVKDLTKLYRKEVAPWAQDFLNKFEEVDSSGTVFRYSGEMPKHICEWVVDIRQLSTAMDFLCREFEHLIRTKEK